MFRVGDVLQVALGEGADIDQFEFRIRCVFCYHFKCLSGWNRHNYDIIFDKYQKLY